MNLRKFGLKLFTQTPTPAAPADLYTPIFHRWIQGQSLEGVLIDVADYSHVYCGPGILLVTHAGNYAMDDANGRHGMSYTRRADPEAGALTDALVADCERLLHACALLEGDSECRGLVTFAANQIEVFSNDRLVAPELGFRLERPRSGSRRTGRPAVWRRCCHVGKGRGVQGQALRKDCLERDGGSRSRSAEAPEVGLGARIAVPRGIAPAAALQGLTQESSTPPQSTWHCLRTCTVMGAAVGAPRRIVDRPPIDWSGAGSLAGQGVRPGRPSPCSQ